jgi:hypothetical protein
MRARHDRRLVQKRLVGLLGVSLILAACSSGGSSAAPASAAPSAAAPSAAPSEAAASAAPSINDKPLEIAYLSFAVANSYDAPMLAAAQGVAAANNAKLTVFDANLDPAAQTKQLQDAAASGKFDAIITQPLYGAVARRDERHQLRHRGRQHRPDARGDNTTAESQMRAERQCRFVPSTLGKKIGDLVVRLAPRRRRTLQRRLHLVGQGRRARPDPAQGLRRGHREPPEIKVVAEGGRSTTAAGLKASQTCSGAP